MSDSSLMTPAALLTYMVGLAMQAYDSVHAQPGPETVWHVALSDGRRAAFAALEADCEKCGECQEWRRIKHPLQNACSQHSRQNERIHHEYDASADALRDRQRIRIARADFEARVTERLSQAAQVVACERDEAERAAMHLRIRAADTGDGPSREPAFRCVAEFG